MQLNAHDNVSRAQAMTMTISIQASVGLHGDNQPDDVLVIKSRLVELGFPFVLADSVMGPNHY